MREEALHRGVVITIASARHADSGANLWQHVVVCMRRVLELLIAVNDQSGHVFLLTPRLLKGPKNLFIVVPSAHLISDNFVIEQIFNR